MTTLKQPFVPQKPKVEEWMLEAALDIYGRSSLVNYYPAAEIIAAWHAANCKDGDEVQK